MFYRRVGIDGELEFLGELPDLRRCTLEIECHRAAWFGAEDDVLGDSHGFNEHEVLVDHADAERDRIVRRLDIAHLAVYEDLSTVGAVEAVGDTHRRRFSGAVLAHNCMDRRGLNDDVDVIVGEYIAESFGYLSEL